MLAPMIVEYYEVVDWQTGEVEYFFLSKDRDAENRKNLDGEASRIWKINTKTMYGLYIKNRTDKPYDKGELFQIMLQAKPTPYSEYYEAKKRAAEIRAMKIADEEDT